MLDPNSITGAVAGGSAHAVQATGHFSARSLLKKTRVGVALFPSQGPMRVSVGVGLMQIPFQVVT